MEIHDAKKSPFWHHHTTMSGYIFGTKACIDNQKKNLLSSNTSSTCPANMINFGLLTAKICWRVWGPPANFNAFRVFGSVTARHSGSGHQPNIAALNIRQGGHHVGQWPHSCIWLHLAWVTDDAKCIVVTRICVSVCGHTRTLLHGPSM